LEYIGEEKLNLLYPVLRDSLWRSLGLGQEFAPACAGQNKDIKDEPPFLAELFLEGVDQNTENGNEIELALQYRQVLSEIAQPDDERGRLLFESAISNLARRRTSGSWPQERQLFWMAAKDTW